MRQTAAALFTPLAAHCNYEVPAMPEHDSCPCNVHMIWQTALFHTFHSYNVVDCRIDLWWPTQVFPTEYKHNVHLGSVHEQAG